MSVILRKKVVFFGQKIRENRKNLIYPSLLYLVSKAYVPPNDFPTD